jgi:hypothetical protein
LRWCCTDNDSEKMPAAMSCAMPAARRLPTVTDDEARRIAANIAKLPALLTREE